MKFKCFVFPSKLLLSVLAALTFFIVSTNASGIDWPEDKATLLDEINHHPTDVISTIENRLKNASLSVHEQAQFHYILSDAYYALFLGDEALAAAKKALLLARKTEDSELVQVCNIKVARAYDTMADPTPGIDYAQQALAWAIENQFPSIRFVLPGKKKKLLPMLALTIRKAVSLTVRGVPRRAQDAARLHLSESL